MSSKGKTTKRVQEIVGWYQGIRNLGVIRNLHTMLMAGNLSGSGFMNPYPVDQGIEHGPDLSLESMPPRDRAD